MKATAIIQYATVTDQDAVKIATDRARIGQQMISMEAGKIKTAP